MYKLRLSQSTQTVLVHKRGRQKGVDESSAAEILVGGARGVAPPPPGGARLSPRVTGPSAARLLTVKQMLWHSGLEGGTFDYST